jgi:hypothetical protein
MRARVPAEKAGFGRFSDVIGGLILTVPTISGCRHRRGGRQVPCSHNMNS